MNCYFPFFNTRPFSRNVCTAYKKWKLCSIVKSMGLTLWFYKNKFTDGSNFCYYLMSRREYCFSLRFLLFHFLNSFVSLGQSSEIIIHDSCFVVTEQV